MVDGQRFLANSFELVLVFFLGGLVFECQGGRDVADPLGLEEQGNIACFILLDYLLHWSYGGTISGQSEKLTFWLVCNHSGYFPLRTRVVNNWNVLGNHFPSWDSEFKLSFDFLRDRCQLVFVKPDVCSVQRLQYHITSVDCRLLRVAAQLKHVLLSVHVTLQRRLGNFFRFCSLTFLSVEIAKCNHIGAGEEGVWNLDFEGLGVRLLCCHHKSLQSIGSLLIFAVISIQRRPVPLGFVFLPVFLRELVARLFQLVISVVQDPYEGEWFFRAAISRECVENLWQLSLANNRVLYFSNVLVS